MFICLVSMVFVKDRGLTRPDEVEPREETPMMDKNITKEPDEEAPSLKDLDELPETRPAPEIPSKTPVVEEPMRVTPERLTV